MFQTASFLELLDEAVARWRRHRADARTRRAVAGLSLHLRKDIGWPGPLPDRHRGHRPPDGAGW